MTQRRRFVAWVLLAVFVPMLLAASVHRHEQRVSYETACYACVHHIPHDGHLSANSAAGMTCVLCHFLSLPFVAAVVLATTLTLIAKRHSTCRLASACATCQHVAYSLRGPPFL